MAKKTGAFKPVKIKQFRDLNMWATPQGTPQTPGPASKQVLGTPDMPQGHTGDMFGRDHLNIEK